MKQAVVTQLIVLATILTLTLFLDLFGAAQAKAAREIDASVNRL